MHCATPSSHPQHKTQACIFITSGNSTIVGLPVSSALKSQSVCLIPLPHLQSLLIKMREARFLCGVLGKSNVLQRNSIGNGDKLINLILYNTYGFHFHAEMKIASQCLLRRGLLLHGACPLPKSLGSRGTEQSRGRGLLVKTNMLLNLCETLVTEGRQTCLL